LSDFVCPVMEGGRELSMELLLERLWLGFAWGPPSHKRIAWIGAIAGIVVLALAAVIVGAGRPLFVLAVLLVGLSEFGWAAELLPRGRIGVAAWARLTRWLCALAGAVLSIFCLLWGQTPAVWFGAVIAGTGVLLALEMAPSGPANRP
jgi:hypothetical protein